MSPADELVGEIREVMWPAEDPERPWDSDTLSDVSYAIGTAAARQSGAPPPYRGGMATSFDTSGGSKADKVIERIKALLYGKRDWDADLLEEVAFVMQGAALGPVKAKVVTVEASGADLEVINRHRSGLGMGPIDPAAGWTATELADMAENIRKTGRMANPRRNARSAGIYWDEQPLGELPDGHLARKLGVSRSSVLEQRRKRGIPPFTTIDWDAQPLGELADTHLAQKLGVDRGTVLLQRQKRGIPPSTPQGRRPTDKAIVWEDQPLGELYDVHLAEKLGVSPTTVMRQRRKRGIPSYTPHGYYPNPPKPRQQVRPVVTPLLREPVIVSVPIDSFPRPTDRKERRATAVTIYREGYHLKSVADHLGVAQGTVSRWVKADVPLRERAERGGPLGLTEAYSLQLGRSPEEAEAHERFLQETHDEMRARGSFSTNPSHQKLKRRLMR